MFPRKTAYLLGFLLFASAFAWVGAPAIAIATPGSQARSPAAPAARHLVLLNGPAGELSFPALELSHAIVSPRGAASGLPTGKRQRKPFVLYLERGATVEDFRSASFPRAR